VAILSKGVKMALLRYLFFFVFSLLIHSLAFSSSPEPRIDYAPTTQQKNNIAIQLVAPKKVQKVIKQPPNKVPEQKPSIQKEELKSADKRLNKPIKKREKMVTKKVVKPMKKSSKIIKKVPEKKLTSQTETIKEAKNETPKEQAKIKEEVKKVDLNTAKQVMPKMVKKVTFSARPSPIDYPYSAKKHNLEGVVLIEVWLDKQGKQIQQRVINSSGHQILDNAALKGISQWQFSRQQDGGQAIAYRVQVPINFGLN